MGLHGVDQNPRKDVRWHTFHAEMRISYTRIQTAVSCFHSDICKSQRVNDYILAEMAEENGIDIRNLIHEQLLKIDNIKQMFSSKTSVAGDIFNLDYTAFENIKISI